MTPNVRFLSLSFNTRRFQLGSLFVFLFVCLMIGGLVVVVLFWVVVFFFWGGGFVPRRRQCNAESGESLLLQKIVYVILIKDPYTEHFVQ